MKKKSLNSFSLGKQKISNLTDLNKIKGGSIFAVASDTDVTGGASCETCSECNPDGCN